MRAAKVAGLGVLLSAAALNAQAPTITLGPLPCLPQKGNAVLTATISPEVPGTTARLYFRRLNVEVEDLYYVEMVPAGGGGYWATFPIPTDSKFPKKDLKNNSYEGRTIERTGNPWAEWWRAKEGSTARNPNGDLDDDTIREKATAGKTEKRSWMAPLDNSTFQKWLDDQATEPGEYFVALYDGYGRQIARSEMASVPVRSDCRVNLTPQQQGYAQNLTIGETAPWQKDDEVFHWECTGIVTRKDTLGVLRADEKCRACVIAAWWPVGGAAGAVALIGVIDDDPIEISPSRP